MSLTSVGFIGAGMMASALMEGLVSKNVVEAPSSLICSDVSEACLETAAKKGYSTTPSNQRVCQTAESAVILAVKPQYIPSVCADVAEIESDATIISIAAGVTLQTLETLLPNRRVVRVMPNTPCLVGEAASAFALGTRAADSDRETVRAIFGSVGLAMEVTTEWHLDAVTGLSGSGPAYAFQFIEALSDGGVRVGLPRDVATRLAAQTLKGAAEMVLKTGKHPGLLKDAVTSPGGTTIAGVEALENGGLRSTTISAVKAATKRSMQLGGVPPEEIANKYNL